MEGNPYINLCKMMRNESNKSIGYRLGKVTSLQPLKIAIGELELEDSDLYFLSGVKAQFVKDATVFLMPTDDEQMYFAIGKVDV